MTTTNDTAADRIQHVGFTGTRIGMTPEQKTMVTGLVFWPVPFVAHHGDCVGADEDFHRILRERGDVYIVGHPPVMNRHRAFCDFDTVEEPKDYLVRDREIVRASDWMIVVPGGFKEELRSGTWATYRYAMELEKTCYIVWPDGRMEKR